MENEWLDRFNVSYEELLQAVDGICPDEVFAEEILGVILLRLTRIIRDNPKKIPSKSKLLNYVRVAAQREMWDQQKEARRQKPIDPQALSELVAREPETRELPSQEQLLEAVTKPELREVLRLLLQGLQKQAIARKLGVSPPTITRRLKAIRKILKSKFGEQFGLEE